MSTPVVDRSTADQTVALVTTYLSDDHLNRYGFWKDAVAECGGSVGYEELSEAFQDFRTLVSSEEHFLALLRLHRGQLVVDFDAKTVAAPKKAGLDAVFLALRPVHEDTPDAELREFFAAHGDGVVYAVARFTGDNKRSAVATVSPSVAEAVLGKEASVAMPSGKSECPLTTRFLPQLHVERAPTAHPPANKAAGAKKGDAAGAGAGGGGAEEQKAGGARRFYIKSGVFLRIAGDGLKTMAASNVSSVVQQKYCPMGGQVTWADFEDSTKAVFFMAFRTPQMAAKTLANAVGNPLPLGGQAVSMKMVREDSQEEMRLKEKVLLFHESKRSAHEQRRNEKRTAEGEAKGKKPAKQARVVAEQKVCGFACFVVFALFLCFYVVFFCFFFIFYLNRILLLALRNTKMTMMMTSLRDAANHSLSHALASKKKEQQKKKTTEKRRT